MAGSERGSPPAAPWLEGRPLEAVREDAEREHILSVLRHVGGTRAQAAGILRISRKTLWKKLKRLGVRAVDVTER
jgi:DNA-binding NtrC family response regulator